MKSLLIWGAPLALAACAETPDLMPSKVLAPAANSHLQIRHIHGPALLTGYTARPVKGPDDWRKLNNQQSPAKEDS